MSCFICSDYHINTIVSFAAGHSMEGYVKTQEAAQTLLDANIRSYNDRYDFPDSSRVIIYKPTSIVSPVQALKLIQCLEYQSADSVNWRESEAYYMLESIKYTTVHLLPGYSDADWEIGDPG